MIAEKKWTSMQKYLLEAQKVKYYSLTKMEDLKNCILKYLKQQKILCKQDMVKFENQRQEDLDKWICI